MPEFRIPNPDPRDARLAHPATTAAVLLEQGARFIESVSSAAYTAPVLGPRSGSIGSQFRHVVDFWACLLRDVAQSHIDYDRRDRDPLVERHRPRAAARLRQLAAALDARGFGDPLSPLWVKCEDDGSDGGAASWHRSSLGRELGFLSSHTIHHYALVGLMARTLGQRVPAGFGVAPSTLAHWQRAPCARSAG